MHENMILATRRTFIYIGLATIATLRSTNIVFHMSAIGFPSTSDLILGYGIGFNGISFAVGCGSGLNRNSCFLLSSGLDLLLSKR